jgi:NAD(P)-dependent dehydrogenase (short-subunit alcohol dehydrogenase family)
MMKNPMDFTGCRYLVTGASSGIGRETAIVLDELGASLVLAGRRLDELEKTAAKLSNPFHIEVMDLSHTAEIPAWLKRVVLATGPLDGAVHSAGIGDVEPLQFLTEIKFQKTIDINLKAAINLAKSYRQKGICRKPGSLVFISSIGARIGMPGKIAYSASKAGLEAACRCMALELAREDIRVNAVVPGLVETEMAQRLIEASTTEQIARLRSLHPLDLGKARDVAYAIAFLLSRETGRWITGTSLVIDGGCTAGFL